MLKTAIVGSGSISRTHAEALKELDLTKIECFCDTDIDKARLRAEVYGGRVYSDLDLMFEKEDIDVLHICTPHYLHVPMAIKALKKGVNVLMEKPPAISYDQYNELKSLVDSDKGAKLGICFQNRYNEAVAEAKRILEANTLGKVLGARAIVTWSRGGKYYTASGWRGQLDKEGGGVLINQSIHTLDLITYLLGPPESVSAASSNFHLQNVINEEDTISAYLKYSDKSVIFFATTANTVDCPILLELFCEKGSLRLENNTLTVRCSDGKKSFKDYTTESVGKSCWGSSHAKLIFDYYDSLINKKDFPVTLDTTLPSFNTMMAIYDSAKCGRSLTPGERI